jgi:hypothetical protein
MTDRILAVTTCGDCCLVDYRVFKQEYRFVCQHPDGDQSEVNGARVAEDCPLRDGALVVELA